MDMPQRGAMRPRRRRRPTAAAAAANGGVSTPSDNNRDPAASSNPPLAASARDSGHPGRGPLGGNAGRTSLVDSTALGDDAANFAKLLAEVPQKQRPSVAPAMGSLATAGSGALWQALGSTEEQRLFNLQVAVSRLVHTMVKDKCLAEHAMGVTDYIRARLTAFLCTLFDGPFETVKECNFTSRATKQQLTDPKDLFYAIYDTHAGAKLRVSREHLQVLVEMLVGAIKSVVDITEDMEFALNKVFFAFQNAITTREALGCNLDGPVLTWAKGYQHVTTVTVGQKITWVWGDDEPQSIKVSGFGDPTVPVFQGFGSDRLVVSRLTPCSPLLVGRSDAITEPVPCVLRSKHDKSSAFSYTKMFDKPGTVYYSGGRYGAAMSGVVNVVLPTWFPPQPSVATSSWNGSSNGDYANLRLECAPGCPYGDVSDGQCNAQCFVADCAFDGGDCACASPDLDFSQCHCEAGQARDSNGSCCQTTAVGEDLTYQFHVHEFASHDEEGDDGAALVGALVSLKNSTLDRYVSDRNRLLVGMYIFQARSSGTNCSSSRFFNLMSSCLGGSSSEPWGVNPHYLPSSSLYDHDAVIDTEEVLGNQPLSANLAYNPDGLQYGFIYPVEGLSEYPLVFDINLNAQSAQRRLTYLVDGFFLDNATRELTVAFITYSGDTELLMLTRVDVEVNVGGAMEVHWHVQPVDVQLYSWSSSTDVARLVLEIIWVICIVINLLGEIGELLHTKYETGAYLNYFRDFWNWVDLTSIALQFACMGIWLTMVTRANSFSIEPRYNIYFSLLEYPAYWAIPDPPTGFNDAMTAYNELVAIIDTTYFYFALQGINIFLVTLRLLKLLDFQPYLGFITRAIRVAAPALAHFFLLWFIVFVSFSLYGFLLFGSSLEAFSTLGQSMLTCFLIILNDNGVYYSLAQLKDWQYVAGIIFWVVYAVVMVFVLLNFLIAIIVDAFMDVKDGESQSTTITQDIVAIAKRAHKRHTTGYSSYDKLLQHLLKLGAEEFRRQEASTMRRHSVGQALARMNIFHFLSDLGKKRPVTKKKVIRIGERKLDSSSVHTILERSYERNVPDTPRTSSRSLRSMKHVPHSTRISIAHKGDVNLDRLSDTVMGLLGEDVAAHEMPTRQMDPLQKAAAAKKQILGIMNAKLEELRNETMTSHSQLLHLSEEAHCTREQLEGLRADTERAMMDLRDAVRRENASVVSEVRMMMTSMKDQLLAQLKQQQQPPPAQQQQ